MHKPLTIKHLMLHFRLTLTLTQHTRPHPDTLILTLLHLCLCLPQAWNPCPYQHLVD
jgi:hypothetical protein